MKHRPFCLPVLNGFNTKYTGRCFIRSPASSKILFSLSQWGSLHALSLCESNELTKDNVGVEWPTDMEGIKSKVDASYSDAGLRREREKTITDFSEVYDSKYIIYITYSRLIQSPQTYSEKTCKQLRRLKKSTQGLLPAWPAD